MIYFQNERFACQSCIRGHRAADCNHIEKLLLSVKSRGTHGGNTIKLKLAYSPTITGITYEQADNKNGRACEGSKKLTFHIDPATTCCFYLCQSKPRFQALEPLSDNDLNIQSYKVNEEPWKTITIVPPDPEDCLDHECHTKKNLKLLRLKMLEEISSLEGEDVHIAAAVRKAVRIPKAQPCKILKRWSNHFNLPVSHIKQNSPKPTRTPPSPQPLVSKETFKEPSRMISDVDNMELYLSDLSYSSDLSDPSGDSDCNEEKAPKGSLFVPRESPCGWVPYRKETQFIQETETQLRFDFDFLAPEISIEEMFGI